MSEPSLAKLLAEVDADEAALEAERAQARRRAASVVGDPTRAPTSELLAMFVGLSIGGALGMSSPVAGTEIDRDHALGVVGEELDRRIPRR